MPWYQRPHLLLAGLALGAVALLSGTQAVAGTLALASKVIAGGPKPIPTASPQLARAVRPPVPTLIDPKVEYTREATITVHASVPASAVGKAGMRLRVYVNDEPVRDRAMAKTRGMPVAGVPLTEGENVITAMLVSRSAQSDPSNAIRITYDGTPPAISISDPPDGRVVNATRATIRGSVDPGSTVTITNVTTRQSVTREAASGAFALGIPMGPGTNAFTISATDPAGNRAEKQLHLVKGDGKMQMALALSRTLVYRNRLPGALGATLTLKDADGQPIDDADVVFSISPPGLPTSTYETRTVNGQATWTLQMPREGALPGRGFATVQVTLPDGRILHSTQRFTFV